MSLSAVRVASGAYKVMDANEDLWYLNNKPENPAKSRWVLTKEGESEEYPFRMKRDALNYIEEAETSFTPKKASPATEDELKNFDFSNPDSWWPPSI